MLSDRSIEVPNIFSLLLKQPCSFSRASANVSYAAVAAARMRGSSGSHEVDSRQLA